MKAAAVVVALVLWQVAAVAINQHILLVGPIDVVSELFVQVREPSFWQSIGFSFARIIFGFIIAFALAVLLAWFSYISETFKTLIWPYMAVIKATPVASIIILILIWLNAENLSIFVSLLIVLPVVYSNLLEGLSSTDKSLLEMAAVFRVGFWRKLKYIYLPQLRPHLIAAFSASIGMAWKSGIAAEVIGIPKGSIGERLYEAKIYLSSKELFAWTVVIIILSVVLEKVLLKLMDLAYKRLWRT